MALAAPIAADTVDTLDNGMEVIYKEVHSSPMVASILFVKSGAKYESGFENGITHFLEHLLFNGTVNLSREELDNSIGDRGGYINAFTRKELTAYLVLLPKQHIDYGMTVQADMLFNAIIPESELPKERQVVLQEIKRANDAPGAAADDFFVEKAYAGTPYDRPVLGYAPFIQNITRAAIVDYWRRYYVPQRMTLLVIGDFATDRMQQTVSSIFESINPPDSLVVPLSDTSDWKALVGQSTYDTVANVTSTYVNFSYQAPHHNDPDWLPFELLARYLDADDISPLVTLLTSGDDPPANDVSVYLTTYDEFSRLEISVTSDRADRAEEIAATIETTMRSLPEHVAPEAAIRGLKVSARTEQIYNTEKLHYYGFLIAPMIFTTGWDFIQNYADLIDTVEWEHCRKAAAKWFSEPRFVATIVRPADSGSENVYTPRSIGEEAVVSHFDTVNFPEYDLSTGYALEFPQEDTMSHELEDPAEYAVDTLDNGMVVIIKSSPESRVFAMNVLGKNRTMSEPDGKAGITDFVNRMIDQGTTTRTASELARDLAMIGANVTLHDNPWIPYDDRYTSRKFSFMKFETIDDFAERGFHLFSDMIQLPAFDSSAVEQVRRSMLQVLGRNSQNPRNVARDNFYRALFDTSQFARPVEGTAQSIASISRTELRAYHEAFYAPQNMIIAIASSHPIDKVRAWVNQRFGRWTANEFSSDRPDRPAPRFEIVREATMLESEQTSLYVGNLLPGAASPEATALSVAVSILSDRLYQSLREKMGLAYSVGAGSSVERDFGWYYAAIGTSPESADTALERIVLEVDKLRFDGPSQDELDRARNQMWGRLMSAKLSRINQAYYLCLDHFLGRPLHYDRVLLKELSGLSRLDILRVAERHFNTEAYVIGIAGPNPSGAGAGN